MPIAQPIMMQEEDIFCLIREWRHSGEGLLRERSTMLTDPHKQRILKAPDSRLRSCCQNQGELQTCDVHIPIRSKPSSEGMEIPSTSPPTFPYQIVYSWRHSSKHSSSNDERHQTWVLMVTHDYISSHLVKDARVEQDFPFFLLYIDELTKKQL